MLSPTSQLRVLESSQVSPPRGAAPESDLPLTFLDAIWLHAQPNERVFFYNYPNSTSHFMESTLPNLKSTLSLALQHFYPLAGKVRRSPQSEDRHEIVYTYGVDSVPFTVAECHEDFDEVSGSHARGVHTIVPLLARLPKSDGGIQPLLALQATVFPNSGVAVAVTMHHAACDGAGTISFLSWWAACCRSGGSPASAVAAPPFLDRSGIPDPRGFYSFNYNLLLKRSHSNKTPTPAPHDKVIACFTLATDHVKELKKLVMSKTSQEDIDSIHCSTLVVTLAYAWVCFVKTQSYPGDMIVRVCLSANCRSNMKPLVPLEYFGNCLWPIVAKAIAGDLVDGDGFIVAVKAVGKVIKSYKEEGVPADFEGYKETMAEGMLQGGNMLVSASPKFGIYSSMDFGWGRPKQAEIVSVARSGALAVSESRNGAGLELGLALAKHEMDAFAAHFYQDLERLVHLARCLEIGNSNLGT